MIDEASTSKGHSLCNHQRKWNLSESATGNKCTRDSVVRVPQGPGLNITHDSVHVKQTPMVCN